MFVATIAGEYAGFVGVTARGVEAQTARGEDLGVHDTVELARAAVAASAVRPPLTAGPGGPTPRRPRRTAARGSFLRTVGDVGTTSPRRGAGRRDAATRRS
ncbi:hypothetical protein C7474_0932 [Microbacterium telephonicum]|uniref:Uncharacterized protein n=1 Tax=Microbacterium telephonicum TaxID=1714841 RepID=A0A498CJ96_9MICO|nr:hypothetical protein C7474_0932 [Microbacterium telephonicum]